MPEQQYSTIQHDAIHKYVFNLKNRYKILETISKKRAFDFDRDNCYTTIEIESPVFSKSDARQFIVDVIINISSVQHCSRPPDSQANGKTLVKVKSFSGKELSLIRGATYRKVVLEIKPRLTISVSSAIGPIKSYAHFLTYKRYYQGVESTRLYEPCMAILTLDSDTSYDPTLNSQSIDVIHISPKEINK